MLFSLLSCFYDACAILGLVVVFVMLVIFLWELLSPVLHKLLHKSRNSSVKDTDIFEIPPARSSFSTQISPCSVSALLGRTAPHRDVDSLTALISGGAGEVGILLAQDLVLRGFQHVVLWDIDTTLLHQARDILVEWVAKHAPEVSIHSYRDCDYTISSAELTTPCTPPLAHTTECAPRTISLYHVDVAQPAMTAHALLHISLSLSIVAPHVLVNSAGTLSSTSLFSCSPSSLARVHAVNALAPLNIARQLLARVQAFQEYFPLVECAQRVVYTITSAASLSYSVRLADYCSAKAAATAFTRALRLEATRALAEPVLYAQFFPRSTATASAMTSTTASRVASTTATAPTSVATPVRVADAPASAAAAAHDELCLHLLTSPTFFAGVHVDRYFALTVPMDVNTPSLFSCSAAHTTPHKHVETASLGSCLEWRAPLPPAASLLALLMGPLVLEPCLPAPATASAATSTPALSQSRAHRVFPVLGAVSWHTLLPWHIDTPMFRGIRVNPLTSQLFPPLAPRAVATAIADAVVEDVRRSVTIGRVFAAHRERVMPGALQYLIPLLSVLPTALCDFATGFVGGWCGMDHFQGRGARVTAGEVMESPGATSSLTNKLRVQYVDFFTRVQRRSCGCPSGV